MTRLDIQMRKDELKLESLRNMQPDIKCLLGPESKIVSRESVWSEIKRLYNSGYTP